MYEYKIKKYIGSYIAALDGLDVLVFTGGIGENQTISRERICNSLTWMGIQVDPEINKARGKELLISTPESRVKVIVVPTDEEFMIASDTMDILKK